MRTNMRLFGVLAFMALILVACATKEKEVVVEEAIDMEQLKTEIQAMENAFAAGQKAKDADAVAVYYADDAINYSQNEQPVSGKTAIRDNIAKDIAKDTTGSYNVYKVVDLFAEGNMAVEIGSWTQFNADGKQIDNGNYMSYLQKRDGKYVCVRDMSTTATPLKKAE